MDAQLFCVAFKTSQATDGYAHSANSLMFGHVIRVARVLFTALVNRNSSKFCFLVYDVSHT